jgi:hypothetical protein
MNTNNKITKEELDFLLENRKNMNSCAYFYNSAYSRSVLKNGEPETMSKEYWKAEREKYREEGHKYWKNLIHKYMGPDANPSDNWFISDKTGEIKLLSQEEMDKVQVFE